MTLAEHIAAAKKTAAEFRAYEREMRAAGDLRTAERAATSARIAERQARVMAKAAREETLHERAVAIFGNC
jgi:hypothetical protein